jgi:hypothetical protein
MLLNNPPTTPLEIQLVCTHFSKYVVLNAMSNDLYANGLFWDVIPCTLVERYQSLKMEVAVSS